MSYWRQAHWATSKVVPLDLDSGRIRVTVTYTSGPSKGQVVVIEPKAAAIESKAGPKNAEYGSWYCSPSNAFRKGLVEAFVMKPGEVALCDQMQGIEQAWSGDWEKLGGDLFRVLKVSHHGRHYQPISKPNEPAGVPAATGYDASVERRRPSSRSNS
jgi:hypothetical protein